MAGKIDNTKIIGGLAVVIVITAAVLSLTKFKLGGQNANSTATNSTNQSSSTTAVNSSANTNANMTAYAYPGRLPDAQIQRQQAKIVTTKGTIVFSLDAKQSPLAVSNFIYLSQAGYYSGIVWHRVESWVVQMGDPQTKDKQVSSLQWGSGGPGYTIPDETVTGEYLKGTVAMAKTAAPNSAGSQIFILKADTPLPKQYQIMGQVTAGQDVVDLLKVGDVVQSVIIEPAA